MFLKYSCILVMVLMSSRVVLYHAYFIYLMRTEMVDGHGPYHYSVEQILKLV